MTTEKDSIPVYVKLIYAKKKALYGIKYFNALVLFFIKYFYCKFNVFFA